MYYVDHPAVSIKAACIHVESQPFLISLNARKSHTKADMCRFKMILKSNLISEIMLLE